MTNHVQNQLHANFLPPIKQKILEEILAMSDSIDQLNDACEILVELSACSKVRDQTIEVQTNYTKLLTAAQGIVNITFFCYF